MSIANTPSSNDFDRLSTPLARFEALFEAVPLAIAVFDDDLRLIRANDRYRDLTSLAPTQSFARPIYDAFPNALADLTEHIDAVAPGPRPRREHRLPFRHPSGSGRRGRSTPGRRAGRGILLIGADARVEELRGY